MSLELTDRVVDILGRLRPEDNRLITLRPLSDATLGRCDLFPPSNASSRLRLFKSLLCVGVGILLLSEVNFIRDTVEVKGGAQPFCDVSAAGDSGCISPSCFCCCSKLVLPTPFLLV